MNILSYFTLEHLPVRNSWELNPHWMHHVYTHQVQALYRVRKRVLKGQRPRVHIWAHFPYNFSQTRCVTCWERGESGSDSSGWFSCSIMWHGKSNISEMCDWWRIGVRWKRQVNSFVIECTQSFWGEHTIQPNQNVLSSWLVPWMLKLEMP